MGCSNGCGLVVTLNQGTQMNRDRFEGKCKQMKGSLQERCARLTGNASGAHEGRRLQYAGQQQERYGIGKEEAERQTREFFKRYGS
jgi:uncharacterized protein YjbJ (UPF0337 family)